MPIRLLRAGPRGVLAVLLALSGAGAGAEAFGPDDLLAVTDVDSIAIAPDGMAVAVSLSRPDIVSDTRIGEIQVIDRRGGAQAGPQILRGASFLKWSKDGRRLHFVIQRDDRVELCDYDRSTRAIDVIARLPFVPVSVSWSPGEKRIALVAERPAARHDWLIPRDISPQAQKPIVVDHALFRDDDGTWLPATEPRLFVLELSGGDLREIPLPPGVSLEETEGGEAGPPAWTADEQALVVSVARGFDARSNLWNVNRDLLKIGLVDGARSWIAESAGVENHPLVSPDGRSLAYLRQRGAPEATVFHRDLVVQDIASGRERLVWAAHDRDVNGFVWSADGQLFARYLDRGRMVLSRVSPKGEERRLSDEVAFTSALTEPARGGAIAFVRTRPELPEEGVVLDRSGRISEWTAFNAALRVREFSEVSEIDFRSAHVDGRMIHAIVARSRGRDDTSSLPVVVDLHGGPYSTRTLNFDMARELFVSQGYVVVQPNYRGSLGYGSAFSQLSDRKHYPGRYDQPDAPSEMGLDVAGVVQAVADHKLGDPSRVFLRGVSAGALLTSWTIGRSQAFKAAVANSWYPGEFDGANYGAYQIRRYFHGPPWDPAHQPEYWRRQPLMLADRMVTPLLILQGERDWVTPFGEAEKFYYALRSRGLDVALVAYPDETHGLRRHPASQRTSLLMEVEWFRRHDTK